MKIQFSFFSRTAISHNNTEKLCQFNELTQRWKKAYFLNLFLLRLLREYFLSFSLFLLCIRWLNTELSLSTVFPHMIVRMLEYALTQSMLGLAHGSLAGVSCVR